MIKISGSCQLPLICQVVIVATSASQACAHARDAKKSSLRPGCSAPRSETEEQTYVRKEQYVKERRNFYKD